MSKAQNQVSLKGIEVMKFPLAVACVCVLASCASTGPYRSSAPEERGERAISSNIELVKEVDLVRSTLGVFYSHEVYESGDAQLLLFTLRRTRGFSVTGKETIDNYDLSRTASLSVDQAKKFLSAIDNYLAMDTKSLAAVKMFNFELYSGILDMTTGNEKHRPFRDLTFIVICSVTNAKKSFKTVLPQAASNLYGRYTLYETFDLNPEQVQDLRQAISAALDKSVPTPTIAPAEKSGT
jgi:hypothetical protein